ncbi:Actin-related protein 2 [Verticillium dahliae VDG1]|nr:Actin-related protein 2 [Verticillium dahliae VDG1]
MSKQLPAGLKESLENSKAEYRQLGKSGLRVSVPIFGCMSFGDKRTLPWVIGEDEALPLLKAAYDRKAIKKYSIPRHKVVILTKAHWAVGEEPEARHFVNRAEFEASKDYQNNFGLSRTALFNQVEASLQRLDTPYIDLLQIHRFDARTPLEETMKALHELVQSGKVRYIGASSMWATQFARLHGTSERDREIVGRVVELADKHGWAIAHVALAWINRRVASPIIGFSSVERLDQALSARGKSLSEEEEKYLEELYQPKAISGHA